MNERFKLLKTPGRVAGALFAAALFASAQAAVARPGTVNYTEGQVTLDGQSLRARDLGKTEVEPGQVLQTANGKAEMLLVPGAYLRVGQNSAVKMLSPSLTNTSVELLQGEALVEVDQIEKENNLNVVDHGTDVRIEKKGVYQFNGNQPMVAVYDGKAVAQLDDRSVDVKKGKELLLQAGMKPHKFDRDQGNDLYAWSKLRSGYLAEANMSSAQTIVLDNPGWWAGTGWYWNPWFDTWAFVPGGGFFYNPFGYGFYSPAYWYYNAPYYYNPGRVWVRRPIGRGFQRGVRGSSPGVARPPAAVGGSGVRFGAPAARGGFARPSAPVMHSARPAGGGGVRFGGARR